MDTDLFEHVNGTLIGLFLGEDGEGFLHGFGTALKSLVGDLRDFLIPLVLDVIEVID